jgi:hypothetical protein
MMFRSWITASGAPRFGLGRQRNRFLILFLMTGTTARQAPATCRRGAMRGRTAFGAISGRWPCRSIASLRISFFDSLRTMNFCTSVSAARLSKASQTDGRMTASRTVSSTAKDSVRSERR